jgi:dephospho-CoA kinase
MIIIGLTGSIGMGKSTVATMLRGLGVPVHDADATVHDFLKPGGRAFREVCAAFPYFSYPKIYGRTWKGKKYIRRKELGAVVFQDAIARKKLENILHPLVRESQNEFIRTMRRAGKKIICLEIPLLFEAGSDSMVDFVMVTSAPYTVQKRRVLDRPGMTEEKLNAILKTQMPDGEKRARADFIIRTGLSRAQTMKDIKSIMRKLQY